MKRSALSLAVAAAIAGVAGSASAQTTQADYFVASQNGVGHHLIMPYYSVQSGNNTLISIVNTDTVNGKAVKVRFRGASNSDDVLDFQVLMSPGDVWTANVSLAADGYPQLTSTDTTCVMPVAFQTNGRVAKFSDTRISQSGRLSAAAKLNELREGYIEILTMADIRNTSLNSGSQIFSAIKHSSAGVAPCTASTLTTLSSMDARLFDATPGLFGNWTVINVPSTRVFTGEATALLGAVASSFDGNGRPVASSDSPVAGYLAKTYQRQNPNPASVDSLNVNNLTSDPLLTGVSPIIEPLIFDLPDLSTPSLSATTVSTPLDQAYMVTYAIQGNRWATEYLGSMEANLETDIVLSQPTRRYYLAVDYESVSIVENAGNNYYEEGINVVLRESLNGVYQACLTTTAFGSVYDREERTEAVTSDDDFSPRRASEVPALCGEVPVMSVNGNTVTAGVYSPTLSANVTLANKNTSTSLPQKDGWLAITTTAAGTNFGSRGLPIIGHQFSRAYNGQVSAGVSGNFAARYNFRLLTK